MKLLRFLLLFSFSATEGFSPNNRRERHPRVLLRAASTTAGIPTEWQGEVLKQLKNIIDPDLGSDIVSLGFVQNLKLEDQKVSFDVELTTPACPVKDQFAADCDRLVRELPWVSDVQVTMTAQENVRETDTFGM